MKASKLLLVFFTLLVTITCQCMSNYQYTDPNSGACVPCSYNCSRCYDSLTCDLCVPQYYLSNKTCFKCSFGCSVCTNTTVCITCNSGLYLNNQGACSPCASGIATCTIATIQTCQSGYFLLSTICAGCFINCKTCNDFVSCSKCNTGYYLASNASSCLACPANCLSCQSSSQCSMCVIGYTHTGTGCAAFNCATIDPFCISCANGACLACQAGKYIQGGKCFQGGSLLCLQANGSDFTGCMTNDYGCQTYSQIQYDTSNNQLPVCLPQSATKFQEFIYLPMPTYTCSGSCSTQNKLSFTYPTTQAYYLLKYYFNIRFYSNNSTRSLTVTLANNNGSSISNTTVAINISQQISSYSQTDSSCLGCIYGQKLISGSFTFSGGQYPTNLTVTDAGGQIQIIEAIYQHFICQVSKCSNCSSAVDCYACFPPYYLQLTSCVTSCDAGFYLYAAICYLQCPVGTFTVSSSYSCQVCISPCLTCSYLTSCLTCVSGYFLEGSVCGLTCSSNYLFANTTSKVCQACPNPCVTCQANGTKVTCLSCASGYLFNGSSCVFLCGWGLYGNYLNNISQCLACSSTCTQCYINSTICSSCSSGYLLLQSTCQNIAVCPSSYYIDTSLNRCLSCHYPCKTCSVTSKNCTSCIKGVLLGYQCLNSCPITYYPNYSNSKNITCSPCVPNCINCVSSTSCISCGNGYYLYQGSCSATCLNGYFANSANNTCTSCVPPCQNCSTASICLSCSTGYLDMTKCTLQCNSTSYIGSSFVCTLCSTPCISCYSSTQCMQCSLPYLLYNSSCINQSQCLNISGYYPYYYPNSSSASWALCSSCTFPCLRCQNNSVACTSCQNGYYYVTETMKCVSQCPISYFLSGMNCTLCNLNCYQCSQTVSNCTRCSAGMYLKNWTCVTNCGNSFYGDDQNQSCVACSLPCGQCYNAYLCITCVTGILYSKQCVSSCPVGTVLNTTANACTDCTNNCYTCSGSTSACLSCSNGFYLYNSSCLSSCPNTYYSNDYTKTCDNCIPPCDNCSSSASCLSCVSSYYFYNNQCLSSCSASYYADNTTRTCVSCNLSICLTCVNNSNGCITCNTGYYLYQKICQSVCPSLTYANSVSGSCDSCPFSCASCLNYTYCITCNNSYYLFSNRCFSQCPIGYYSDSTSKCQTCIENCQICNSSSTCKQCKTNYYIFNSGCVSACAINYYPGVQPITNYNACLQCQKNCDNCTAYDYCVSCNPGFIQFNGMCLTQCPIFYYSDANNICSQCSTYCSACVNSSYCTNCIGTYLYNNQCVIKCPAQTYSYEGTSCKRCSSPCFNCSGDYTCTSCLSGYIYFHDYCVFSCPSDVWYYPSNNSCNANCPYNKLTSSMHCYIGSCGSQMVTLNGYCLSQCGTGYYVNTNQQCTLCSSNSAICGSLFLADLQILYMDVLTLSLYYNQKAQLVSFSEITVKLIDIDGNSVNTTLTSYNISQYQVILKYTYDAVNLVNVSLTLSYIKSMESDQRISSNTYKKQLPNYSNYGSYIPPSFLNLIPMAVIAILFILIIINMCNQESRFTQLLDFIQLVAVTLYLDIQYPPVLENFLSGFKISLFIFTKNMLQMAPYTFSPPKFIYYNIDTLIFRNQLFLLLVFFITVIFFGVVIAVHTYNPHKLRKLVKLIRYRILNDIFSICMTPLFLFACQISGAKPTQLAITAIILLIGLGYVVWISYKIIQIKKMSELSGLLGDFQRTQSKVGLMYTPFAYARKIVFTIGLGLAPYQPISTITLLLVLTFLIMVCVYFYQPFDNNITDYVTIFMQSSLTLYVVCLIILGLNVLSPQSSHNMGIFTVSLVIITMIVCLFWLIYLTVNDIRTKGCCPSVFIQQQAGGKDDYSEKKYGQDEQQIHKMQGLQNNKKEQAPDKSFNLPKQHQKAQESGQQFLGRFERQDEELFSDKNDNNEQFKHWNEQSSQSNQNESKKEICKLPQMMIKIERKEDI